MAVYYDGGIVGLVVCILILFYFIVPTYFEKNTVKTKDCKIDRYEIEDYWGHEVIITDKLRKRTICRFRMKDKKLAYELAELCVKRLGGCEDD